MADSSEKPLDVLYHLMWGFAGQRVVSAAAKSGLLKELAAGWASPSELAAKAGLDPLATGKVLRALTAAGVVEAEGDRYRLREELAPLFAGGEVDLNPFVAHIDGLNDSWGKTLEEWLRTGAQPERKRDPEGTRRFGAAMRAMASLLAPQVADSLGFADIHRALDIGGGVGRYAEVLCGRAPELRFTVLDMPETVELGRETLAGTPVADRVTFVGGSYHDADLGKGYDLVLLANILHQEKAEAAAALVGRAAKALAPSGRLAIVDFAIDEAQREVLMGALFAINMRSFGDTYSESTIRGWMEAAGLAVEPARPLAPVHWLIEGRRPSH